MRISTTRFARDPGAGRRPRKASLRVPGACALALSTLLAAGVPLEAQARSGAPALTGPRAPARSASSASRASVSQTQKNSSRYRRSKSAEASRDRARIRRATRRSRYGAHHQPGGYCIYDTQGNVILRPDGVECEDQKGDYMNATPGSPPAAGAPQGVGCVSGSCSNGRGLYVWKNGAQYAGEFRDGRQHGQGTLTLPDGSSYSGDWRSGRRHGQGTATYADGRVEQGWWKDNKYVGRSKARRLAIRWPDLSKVPPKTVGGGSKDAAVVIGITHYSQVAEVAGAARNASDWYNYLVKSREVPLARVSLLLDEDATVEEIELAAEDAARRVKRGGTLWFVFVGHGAPSRDGKDGLLVGFDAQQKARSIESRSLRRSRLVDVLQTSKAKHIQILLDACFSGRTGTGQQLIAGLQPLVVTASSLDSDIEPRTTLLTAAASDEYAGPLPGAARPAFSYLALGGMRGWADADDDGRITSGELHGYVTQAMRALVRDRRQRPTLVGANDVRLAKSGREHGPDLAEIVVESSLR